MVDWRDRFRAGRITAASRARHRPERGVVLADHEGNEEAYAWDVPSGSLRRISDSGTAVLEAAIRPDGASIVYHRDPTGSEFGHLHEAPFDGGEGVDLTPDLPDYGAFLLAAEADTLVAAIALDDEQSILCVHRGTAHVWSAPSAVLDLRLAPDGATVAVAEAMDGLFGRTILRSVPDGEELDRLDLSWPGASHAGRWAVSVHRDGWLRPAIWTPGHGVEAIETDLSGDVRAHDWSADGRRILLVGWHRATSTMAWYDTATGETTPILAPPGTAAEWLRAEIHDGAVTSVRCDATRPWSAWESDEQGARRLLSVAEPDTYPGAAWESVELASADGTAVQAWLLTPRGSGPWPAILHAHGGPTAVMVATFSATCQAWVDHGFAVLSVNYRGSTTFGDDFREGLTRHVGEVDVADVMAGHEWLVRSGVADPTRIIINGYSYGGYLALQCAALHPEAFAASIAGAPVADWVLSAEDQSALLDAYDRALFGGTMDETRDAKWRASPRAYVDRFRAPVLITTPTEDTRTPLRPILAFVDDLRAAGKDVELEQLEGGHVGVGAEQEIRMMERWLGFAHRIVSSGSARIGGA